ncbi:MAG: large-conductance mechanosensitive channel protein MscL [Gammaproteobacteria bacterium]|nr:large-conductance mechanosensitive channel protein MscL [Gammaproteobacteria bacterium]
MLKEFKEFAMRGNLIDMAVGIIIGTAFGKVITSLVNDVLMPPIGMLLGKVDFSDLGITLHQRTATSAAVIVKYGMFINTIIDFLIIAFAMFMVIKQMNRFLKKEKTEDSLKECPYCCSKIAVKATRCPDCTSQLG